jgi:hypothetical protein
MNSDFPTRLTSQLRANPLYFEEMDEILLSELVCHYYEGKLDADDAAEVEALLKTDSTAKEIYVRLQAADRFSASPEGKAWLENLPDRVLPPRKIGVSSTPAPAFFGHLPEFLPLAAASTAPGSMEFTVAGMPGIRVILRHQSARLAVYDDTGEPSTSLGDHRIVGRTSDKTDLQDFGLISGWKATLPPGSTVEHLLSPDGSYKLTLTSVPPV